jgi:ATP-dependent exoDNAse (exonuclease V) alpha subunit
MPVAIYRLQIKPVTRSTGRTATSAAAYRAGERIRDERTGALHNHSQRRDVLHKEILLPSSVEQFSARMEWARDRATLWNAAEKAERKSNSRVAREYQVALPPELSAEERITLARTFSREIADRYNVAVDLAVHAPRPEGDPRNFHAHLLATTREVTPDGLGPKTGLDRSREALSELGLPKGREEFANLRARWAELTNDALRQANVEARVDHRSLAAQGIDREPRAQLPWGAYEVERRGGRSELAERIREHHHERWVAQRREQQKAPAPSAERSAGVQREKPASRPEPPLARDMDARRRQAVQDWLKHRQDQVRDGQGHERSPPLSMDEIRQRAVAAWRALQARGAESLPSAENRREHVTGRDRDEAERARDTPALGDDLSD